MKISGEHALASPRERVWAALHDPRALADAVPGVKRLELQGPDEYAISVSVGVGSVRGTYDGTIRLSDEQALEGCAVRASATGAPGSVDAVARLRMRDADGGGVLLSYEADASVTGPLAGVGQRLVAGAARRTTEEFLAALDRGIRAPQALEAPPAPAFATAGPPARRSADPLVVAVSVLAGFLLALAGVAVGRWTAGR